MAFGRLVSVESGAPGEMSTIVQDLFISFEIEMYLWCCNKAKIKIYNLSRETANKMGEIKNIINMKASYADESSTIPPSASNTIFWGQITKSKYGKEDVNTILEIEAHDLAANKGGSQVGNRMFVKSYKAGSLVQNAYNDIKSVLSFPIDGADPYFGGMIYSGGMPFACLATKALEKVLAKIDCKYTIQNGRIMIFDKNGKSSVSKGLTLDLESGLIKVEKLEQVISSKKSKKNKAGTRYKITSLLFPQLIPGTQIKVNLPPLEAGTDQFGSTQVQIESCKMWGDNFGGDFKAECEVKTV